MQLKHHNLIAVVGATATGKTGLAVALAKQCQGEILSADSRQVYRGLDIGSGKDLHEYGDIPYHLIDIIEPTEEYNLFNYQRDFYSAFKKLRQDNTLAILSGGSFMYIDAVVSGYQLAEVPINDQLRRQWATVAELQLQEELQRLNPTLHNSTDLEDRGRLLRALEIATHESQHSNNQQAETPEIKPLFLSIDWPRETRRERIKQRLKARLKEGMIEEVEQLNNAGVSWEKLNYFGLEYRLIGQHLQQQLSYNDMYQKLASAIIKFAKKQDTWLRKLEKKGFTIHRLNPSDDLLGQAMIIIETEN